MKQSNPQKALEKVAAVGLVHAQEEDVLRVAEALWHEGFVPDLRMLSETQQREAAYLVGRLARFNVLKRERKLLLLKSVEQLRKTLPHSPKGVTKVNDPLASEWGATSDLNRFMGKLLPMQTRHFVRKPAGF